MNKVFGIYNFDGFNFSLNFLLIVTKLEIIVFYVIFLDNYIER